MPSRFVALALFIFSASLSSLRAQQALPESLPSVEVTTAKDAPVDSAWIDLRQNAPTTKATTQTAPAWVESVGLAETRVVDKIARTVFRIRLTRPAGQDFAVLFFRIFFDDKPDARPELVAWDESGTQVLRSRALGAGIDVPTSDSVMIPMHEISAIDIEVPGDGTTVRGVYMDWMTSTEVMHPLGTDHRDLVAEPFSTTPKLGSPEQDKEQFGTVTATLAPETLRIGPSVEHGAAFEFAIESQPLLALLTFEVASPRIDAPPEVFVNGETVGAVTLTLPDLADPGYRGQVESLVKGMRFQYTGWVRAQKLVPLSALKTGTNNFTIINGAGASSAAIRGTQVQLKYLWDKSDYLLQPSH
jgi:hypothetical protein